MTTTAQDLRDRLEQDNALAWHLRYNHYPRQPLELLQAAKDAIDAANAGDLGRLIALPEGITTQGGATSQTAAELIEALHLDGFLTTQEGG